MVRIENEFALFFEEETSVTFHDRCEVHVLQLYGTSETGTVALNQRDRPDLLESVGLPISGVEVEIFTESGKIAPPEEEGDIGIRSPAATTEYPGLPEATASAFPSIFQIPVRRVVEKGSYLPPATPDLASDAWRPM
jgi:acyl-coenzyme A synthetase/AMP-(fatty) acid ligase